MLSKAYTFLVGIILFGICSSAYPEQEKYEKSQERWVEKVFESLSEEERIAQLFSVATASYANEATRHYIYEKEEEHYQAIEELIRRYNIGGLSFFKGRPIKQAQLINRYQKAAKTPLLIAMDAEWGAGMRLDSTISYPKQMTLGAIHDNQLIYNMGAEIARQLRLLGVHINFAPVIDINNNPKNPVIGSRSFGDDKYKVAE